MPGVVASRDIGKPHWILSWMRKRLKIILTRPDLLERLDLRPKFNVLDNDEPSRQHIHTVVRTPNGNDYGMDLLRQHRQQVDHSRL